MRTQLVINRDLTASCLIQYRDLDTIAETAFAVDEQYTDIFYVAPVPDLIIGNEIVNVADVTSVTHRDIVKASIPYFGMSDYATLNREAMVHRTESHLAAETDVRYSRRVKAFSYLYCTPILSTTAGSNEYFYFLVA